MLQAKDLRIGNYIKMQNLNRPIRVSIIDTTETSICTKAEPIPLTEEILKNNFSFKKTYKIGNKKYFEHSEYRISFTVVDNCFVFDFGPATIGQRGYVHEVQNLFKELTQKDIEINL